MEMLGSMLQHVRHEKGLACFAGKALTYCIYLRKRLERVKGIGPSTRSLGSFLVHGLNRLFLRILQFKTHSERIKNIIALRGHSADARPIASAASRMKSGW